MRPLIVAHSLVRNEQRFVWYSLQSVLPFVDQIMVWDTGSTDNTVAIIKTIDSAKIKIKQLSSVTPVTFTQVSQQMITATPKRFTWLLILDGDEIWPEKSILTAVDFAHRHPGYDSIVVRTHNLVGDIYHRLPDSAGHYRLASQTGHLALRFVNLHRLPGLHFARPHGQRSLFDAADRLVQDRDPQKIKFLPVAYHHATHLQRSSTRTHDQAVPKRGPKLKFELGQKIPPSQIPEVFSKPHPPTVPDVTAPAPLYFWLRAALLTPAKRLKRFLFPPPSGY